MSDVSEVPDKVIEQATLRLDRAAHQQTCAVHGYSGEPMRDPEGDVMWSLKVGVLAAAPVIAAWARSQERDQIRKVISEFQDRAYTRDGEYIDVPYWEGAFDLVGHLEDRLPSLDREGDQ